MSCTTAPPIIHGAAATECGSCCSTHTPTFRRKRALHNDVLPACWRPTIKSRSAAHGSEPRDSFKARRHSANATRSHASQTEREAEGESTCEQTRQRRVLAHQLISYDQGMYARNADSIEDLDEEVHHVRPCPFRYIRRWKHQLPIVLDDQLLQWIQ